MSSPSPYLTAALYKFVDLPDFADLQAPLQACCEAHNVKGTLLLAREGINGTIAGPEAGVRAVLAFLRADPRLSSLQHKESWSPKPPFTRMKVKLKKEIVTLRVSALDPNKTVGQYVKPADWNALLVDPDVVVIDTRNDYVWPLALSRALSILTSKTLSNCRPGLTRTPGCKARPPKRPRWRCSVPAASAAKNPPHS